MASARALAGLGRWFSASAQWRRPPCGLCGVAGGPPAPAGCPGLGSQCRERLPVERAPRSSRGVRGPGGLCGRVQVSACFTPAGIRLAKPAPRPAPEPSAGGRAWPAAMRAADSWRGCRRAGPGARERAVPTRPCRRALRWSLLTESKRLIKRRKAVSRSVVLGGRQRPRPQRSRPEPRPPAEGHCVRCARRGLAQTRAG